jgi:hypothetical protein
MRGGGKGKLPAPSVIKAIVLPASYTQHPTVHTAKEVREKSSYQSVLNIGETVSEKGAT